MNARFPPVASEGHAPAMKHGPAPVNAVTMHFWSLKQVKRPEVPKVKHTAWVKNPIDAFVLSKLEANGMSPATRASKNVLIRRAYYDLLGLPPSPEDVRSFLA